MWSDSLLVIKHLTDDLDQERILLQELPGMTRAWVYCHKCGHGESFLCYAEQEKELDAHWYRTHKCGYINRMRYENGYEAQIPYRPLLEEISGQQEELPNEAFEDNYDFEGVDFEDLLA